MSDTPDHTLLDDAQGMTLGVFMCGLGIQILTHLGLITGQTAGLALLVSYSAGLDFGIVFFAVNLPFYVLAWRRLGRTFTIKSLLSVTALSILTSLLPSGIEIAYLHPVLGTVLQGSLIGLGLIILFRHGGSLGGIGVLALYLQDRTGFRAGYVQLIFDIVLFGIAALIFAPSVVALSLLGAVVLNLIVAVNHRRDRYVAT
ncbi:YitT family protein [Palleronia sp. LCG004]|uniref:YitT family protein n=1 Tax=Palleronia sp. LCG004 TaxID=3079304 RepID=UPI002942BD60|nr:YitT family protein [Palleronia sp. LCG004]WOI57034.1 YitT family protein [Palleronia sp. LCG004]